MKEKLTNNLSLKILSLLVAILVWLLAVNICLLYTSPSPRD